jgi:ferredoxin-nitrite reductase
VNHDSECIPTVVESEKPAPISVGTNAVEGYKTSMGGNGLRVLDHLPQIIERGVAALTPSEKELLKWVGVFFRKPTPGKFMMRVRMPNGFVRSEQLRTIAELSRRLGNGVLDITTRQQIELRGFTLDTVPEIFEKLRGVDLRTLQTGSTTFAISMLRAGWLTPHEVFDASPVVHELDRIIVGSEGNPEFTNLPRKFNITVTGCTDNCTHSESQDIALVPRKRLAASDSTCWRAARWVRWIHGRLAAECFCRNLPGVRGGD